MKMFNVMDKLYVADIYLMNDTYDTIARLVYDGKDLEEFKEYLLNRYSNLRNEHGIMIREINVSLGIMKDVWYKEGI